MNLRNPFITLHKLWILFYVIKIFCASFESVGGVKDFINGDAHNVTSIPPEIQSDLIENASVCMDKQQWLLQEINFTKPYSICYSKNMIPKSDHLSFIQPFPVPRNKLPNSGLHRGDWAAFGEYDFVPAERFVHNLEHGGAVFLYHPCAPIELVSALRVIARNCTWRHVISAYPYVLNKTYPLAIITYGCEYRMSSINASDIKTFMVNRATSPEPGVIRQGSYKYGLLNASKAPKQDPKSDKFCENLADEYPSLTKKILALKRSNENTSTTATQTDVKTPRTEEAAWAVGSLLFLLIVLTLAICYTQLWRKGNHGESFEHSRVWNDESQPGSVSIAAIVRKLPNMIRGKMDRARSRRISRDRQYQRIREDSYSEDEV